MRKYDLTKSAEQLNARLNRYYGNELDNSKFNQDFLSLKKSWDTDNGREIESQIQTDLDILNENLNAICADVKQLKDIRISVSFYSRTETSTGE